MLRYIKYQNQNQATSAYGKWYLRAVTEETVDVNGLAEHMAAHNTPYSRGVIQGVLTDMVRCIKELMLDSKAVKLADLCIFKIGLVCTGAERREDAKVSNVTGIRFNAKATGEMAVSQLKSQIQLKELKHYTLGNSEINPDDENPNGPSEGNEENETTLYTLTFQHDGEVNQTLQLAEGASITAPQAPEGYHWVDVPTRMPAHALTIESAADGGFTPPSFS